MVELPSIGANQAYYCNYTIYDSAVNMPRKITDGLYGMTDFEEYTTNYYQDLKKTLRDPAYIPLFVGTATAIVWFSGLYGGKILDKHFPQASDALYNTINSGLKFIGGFAIPTFISHLKPVQNLIPDWQKDYDIIESYMSPVQKQVTHRLVDFYKVHGYKWVYMVQTPGQCLDPQEQINSYHDENSKEWLLCYRAQARPSEYLETLEYKDIWSQYYYPYIASVVTGGITMGLVMLTQSPFTAYKFGLIIGTAIGTEYIAEKLTPKHHAINYQQLEANEYIHEHQGKSLYMIQAPGQCNEGDIGHSFEDNNGIIRWIVCEVVGESSTSCSNVAMLN